MFFLCLLLGCVSVLVCVCLDFCHIFRRCHDVLYRLLDSSWSPATFSAHFIDLYHSPSVFRSLSPRCMLTNARASLTGRPTRRRAGQANNRATAQDLDIWDPTGVAKDIDPLVSLFALDSVIVVVSSCSRISRCFASVRASHPTPNDSRVDDCLDLLDGSVE